MEDLKEKKKVINKGYKSSDLGWIPNDWEIKKIGKIAKTTAGGTPTTSKPNYWNGNIKWMSSGDLNLKRVFDVEGRISEEGLKNSSTKILPANCILIGLAGQGKTRGTVAMNMIELCTNQSVAAILPSDNYIGDYLYHNLDYRYNELRQLSTGDGGRGGLNLAIINSVKILLPSLPEQKAIADCLSTWDKGIEKLNQLIAQKELRKKGLMQELLTGKKRLRGFDGEWSIFSLNMVAEFLNGKAYTQDELLDEGKYKVLRVGNFFNNSKWYYSNLELNENKYVNEGDLMYAWSASFGPRFWNSTKTIYHYHIWKVLPKHLIDKLFLYYFLVFDTDMIFNNKQGGTMFHITKGDMEKRKIKLPTKGEQIVIGKILESADKEIQLLKNKLEQFKVQKKGLMQVLLTGKKRLKY